MGKRGGLGKGLEALFSDNEVKEASSGRVEVRITEVEPNKDQPRRSFDESSISALADSIKEHGLLQPILVRPLDSGGYQIVAGERRWRACRMLGMSEIGVTIKEISDQQAAQIALVENLMRENLNPLEEAMGYRDLMDRYGMTQENVGKTVGKSRSAIANALRMLNLPDEIQELIKRGKISAGHAKALGSFQDESNMLKAAYKASEGGLSVRALENLAMHEANTGNSSDSDGDSDDGEKENHFEHTESGGSGTIGLTSINYDIYENGSDIALSQKEIVERESEKTVLEILARDTPRINVDSEGALDIETDYSSPKNMPGENKQVMSSMNTTGKGWQDGIDKYIREMEISLSGFLKRRVKIEYNKNHGKISIDFYDEKDLNEIAKNLTGYYSSI